MREMLAQILRHRPKSPLPLHDLTPSAVLVPLVVQNGNYHVLFTQRSMEVRDHKGQISFPGGCWEKEDPDLLATALRETEEELGIPRQNIEVLGELEDLCTPTRYRITPLVGLITDSVSYRLDPKETAAVIEIPLPHLLQPQNLRLESRSHFNQAVEMPYFQFKEHVIWGATGKITHELIGLIQEHYNQQAS